MPAARMWVTRHLVVTDSVHATVAACDHLETAAAVEADEVVLPRGVVAPDDRARLVAEAARPVVVVPGP